MRWLHIIVALLCLSVSLTSCRWRLRSFDTEHKDALRSGVAIPEGSTVPFSGRWVRDYAPLEPGDDTLMDAMKELKMIEGQPE
jgi:hypothetical protein